MIKVSKLNKKIANNSILENISCEFEKGRIYGIVGINGAGKSTLLRHIAGIYVPDSGTIQIDDVDIYENEDLKKTILFLSDEPYFGQNATIKNLKSFYKDVYEDFDETIFNSLIELFRIDINKHINNFSKGMKKQVTILMALSCCPKYIIFDETFDGIDPLIRIKIKKYIINLVEEKDICVIISSHNINDLENLCDYLIMIENKRVNFTREISDISETIHKVQGWFEQEIVKEDFNDCNILNISKIGSLTTIIVSGCTVMELESKIEILNPKVFDILPLSLEEVFLYEMEASYNE